MADPTRAAPFFTPVQIVAGSGSTPLGYQQFAAGSLATAQPLTVPAGANSALVEAEAQGVRWRDDGTAPTATVGMPIPSGGSTTFYGAAELAALKFIAASAGAILNVSYYA